MFLFANRVILSTQPTQCHLEQWLGKHLAQPAEPPQTLYAPQAFSQTLFYQSLEYCWKSLAEQARPRSTGAEPLSPKSEAGPAVKDLSPRCGTANAFTGKPGDVSTKPQLTYAK